MTTATLAHLFIDKEPITFTSLSDYCEIVHTAYIFY